MSNVRACIGHTVSGEGGLCRLVMPTMNQMTHSQHQSRPLIAISPDLLDRNGHETVRCTSAYAKAIWSAGGLGVVVPPIVDSIPDLVSRFDGFVLSGGDDPVMEPFDTPSHPMTTPVHPARQQFETELLRYLQSKNPDTPVLGVCLGMQMMALLGGGSLDQYMPETTQTHEKHWENHHEVGPVDGVEFASGIVRSKHHQAVSDAGRLRTLACSSDGVIEAIEDPDRKFFVGVQWHPERTEDPVLGQAIFDRLVECCR
jgi:putative glutamine amidotransferase